MPMLVCPACESSNGHSFSCPLLTARVEYESDYVDPWLDVIEESYLYDESDDLEFYGFDSESDWRNAFDDDAEDFSDLEFDENFQTLLQLKNGVSLH